MAEVAEVGRQNRRGDDGLGSHGEDARSLERGVRRVMMRRGSYVGGFMAQKLPTWWGLVGDVGGVLFCGRGEWPRPC